VGSDEHAENDDDVVVEGTSNVLEGAVAASLHEEIQQDFSDANKVTPETSLSDSTDLVIVTACAEEAAAAVADAEVRGSAAAEGTSSVSQSTLPRSDSVREPLMQQATVTAEFTAVEEQPAQPAPGLAVAPVPSSILWSATAPTVLHPSTSSTAESPSAVTPTSGLPIKKRKYSFPDASPTPCLQLTAVSTTAPATAPAVHGQQGEAHTIPTGSDDGIVQAEASSLLGSPDTGAASSMKWMKEICEVPGAAPVIVAPAVHVNEQHHMLRVVHGADELQRVAGQQQMES
jgi:hypothetical protein